MLETPEATDQRTDIKTRLASQAAERQHQLRTACFAIATGEQVDSDFVLDLCSQLGVDENAFGFMMRLADREGKRQEIERKAEAAFVAKSAAYKRVRELAEAEKPIVEKYEKWLRDNRPKGEPTAAETKAIRKQRAPVLDIQDDLTEARRIADSRNREHASLSDSLNYFDSETRKLVDKCRGEHPALCWL
ncbi:hypothetical protein [Rosistilla oblonga]|uniref:Uncharacterized protein n=1 Tax=Rosistilla oblonga TaxID=2527990 RepID=A0A518ITI5_9BACT|nr:hypothetical protein [Rosistilla oblonga]QDV56404.1 hypothetical protein Mal33_23940 [Rosistilla oblonga]